MWPGSVKLLLVTVFLLSFAYEAQAQNQQQPLPPMQQPLGQQGSIATPSNLNALPPMQSSTAQNNPPTAQPVGPTPAAAPVTPEQVSAQPQPIPQQPPMDGFMPQNPVASNASVPLSPIDPAPATAAPTTETTAPATQTAAPAETTAEDIQAPAQATTTEGFSTATGNTNLAVNNGLMPMTNNGINMNLDPNMVGGYDPNLPPAANVPYEVQLEQRNAEIEQKTRAMAYEQAKRSTLPMETYEIRDLLGRLKDTQEAVQTPVRPAPTPKNVIKTISTDPSAKPPVIHLNTGNVSTVNIVDVTGEPWPIVDIGFGGPFDVKPPEAGGHVIRITPLKDFAHGNLVVRLLKLTTPITFSLKAGGDVVNYRFDARLPEYGPNAKMPLIDDGIFSMAGDKVTTSFLEGVPPKGAKKMVVEGIDGRTNAYRYAGALYVRTPLSLLSPAWMGSATSADGMNVYVLDDAPVLLLSDRGSLVRARIGEETKEFKE